MSASSATRPFLVPDTPPPYNPRPTCYYPLFSACLRRTRGSQFGYEAAAYFSDGRASDVCLLPGEEFYTFRGGAAVVGLSVKGLRVLRGREGAGVRTLRGWRGFREGCVYLG